MAAPADLTLASTVKLSSGYEMPRLGFGVYQNYDTTASTLEAFAAGTAFFVAPVGLIHYKNKDIEIPTGDGESGDYAKVLKGWLGGIMYGKETHEWGVVVDEVEA